MRTDPVLVVAAALFFGASAAVAPLPAIAAALGVAIVLLSARLRVAVLVVAALAFGAGAARAHVALARFEARRVATRDALGGPSRCAGRATVTSSPVWTDGRLGYLADFDRLDCEGRVLAGPLRARLYGGPALLARGDRVRVVAELAAVNLRRNVGLPDPTPHAARQGSLVSGTTLSATVLRHGLSPNALIDHVRAHVRRRIQVTFAPDAAAMARALVIGENDLTDRDNLAFRKSGLAHLLAVSGTHLVLAVVTFLEALKALLVRVERLAARFEVARLVAAVGAPLALVYADFAGGGGSARRAAWMLAAAFTVRAFGRRPRASRVLGVALFTGAVLDPLAVFDISFLLSAAATVGLLLIGVPLMRRVSRLRPRVLGYLASCAAMTLAAMIACAPLLALLSPTLSVASVGANVLAAPVGELVALPLCLAHAVLGFSPFLERGAALVASGALLAVKGVARGAAAAKWLAFSVPAPDAWQFALLAVGFVGLLVARGRRHAWLLGTFAGLALLELAIRRTGDPRGALSVRVLDAAGADSTLVDFPDGRAMLIDGDSTAGPAGDALRSVLEPLLRADRRDRIDVVVTTRPHSGPFVGIERELPGIRVGEYWDAGSTSPDARYAARRTRAPVLEPPDLCGRVFQFGAARVTPLAPCHASGTGAGSIVLAIRLGKRSVLFTGDAGPQVQARLPRADLLKVGHHGGPASTTPALLRKVRPALAAISCGVRNRFGYPNRATLANLAAAGVATLRTDRVGSIVWTTDGAHVAVRTFSAPQ